MISRLWSWLCSLKLAVVLASLATITAIAVSLLIHFNPQVFATLDQFELSDWYTNFGSKAPSLTIWFYLTGILVILLAINTYCCFIDWLSHLRVRWRKTGEYLIHLGFVLIVAAYFWGSFSGSRRADVALAPGQLLPLPEMPGYFLRLDQIEPVIGSGGYPVDFHQTVSLLHGDQPEQTLTLAANTPLIVGDLVIVATGTRPQIFGYSVLLPELRRAANLFPGAEIDLAGTTHLQVQDIRFDGPLAPLLQLALIDGTTQIWQGWYSMRQPPPEQLRAAGFRPVVNRPLQQIGSVLTIHRDPGRRLALFGAGLLTIGVILALFSFYAKRRRGERPEVA